MAEPADRLDDFLAFLDVASREARAREAAHAAWVEEGGHAIARELTEKLIPSDLRAAGIRLEWTAQP